MREFNSIRDEELKAEIARECPEFTEGSEGLAKPSGPPKVRKGKEGKGEGECREGGQHPAPEAERLISHLNEKAGSAFRPVESHLRFIRARLKEPGVTFEECKAMIDRQVAIWKGTSQEQYLRPATLFNETKFAVYYDSRLLPLPANGNGFQKPKPKYLTPEEVRAQQAALDAAEEAKQKARHADQP